MDEMCKKITSFIAEEFDKNLLEAFELHGYSKEWLMDPVNKGRVMQTTVLGFCNHIFSVDGVAIFSVVTDGVVCENDTYVCKYRIEHY